MEAYDVIKESVRLFGENPSKDRNLRNDQMDSKEIDYNELDSKYYEICDFEADLLNFIKENRKHFYFDGIIMKPKVF